LSSATSTATTTIDAEATLPSLVEAVKSEITAAHRTAIEKRGQAAQTAYAQSKDRMRTDAAAAAFPGWS